MSDAEPIDPALVTMLMACTACQPWAEQIPGPYHLDDQPDRRNVVEDRDGVALQLGINPLQYGIILVESFGIGSILPPIGIALYVSCAICGARVERATKPLLWYLAVMFVGLMLVATIPWITTVLPALFNFKS